MNILQQASQIKKATGTNDLEIARFGRTFDKGNQRVELEAILEELSDRIADAEPFEVQAWVNYDLGFVKICKGDFNQGMDIVLRAVLLGAQSIPDVLFEITYMTWALFVYISETGKVPPLLISSYIGWTINQLNSIQNQIPSESILHQEINGTKFWLSMIGESAFRRWMGDLSIDEQNLSSAYEGARRLDVLTRNKLGVHNWLEMQIGGL